MPISPADRDHLVLRLTKANPNLKPQLLEGLIDDVATTIGDRPGAAADPPAAPFAVSWMDSYLAHWMFNDKLAPGENRFAEVSGVLQDLLDAKFDERRAEIIEAIRARRPELEPPDGGTPEPGVPPVGPVGPALVFEPPDGGPPEPGVPPVGPSSVFEPPDGGPPEPGVPPTGPDAAFLGENPWILYWFISLKAPILLDVVDAHMTRRLAELGFERR